MNTHLNPTNLMLNKVDQEPISNLVRLASDLLQQCSFWWLQRRYTRALETTAQHLQPETNIPEIPYILRVDSQIGSRVSPKLITAIHPLLLCRIRTLLLDHQSAGQ